MLAAFCALATLSLLQGFLDILIPTVRGEPSFGFLFSMTERFGPWFLVAYIFVHNMGLACLVPGYGFLAARFEKSTKNRWIIGLLLSGAVVTSLLVAAQLVFTTAERFDLRLASIWLLGEAGSVLFLTLVATRQLKDFIPTRRYAWSLITPFQRLRVPLVFAVTMLLLLSVWETHHIVGL